jgi:ABC-2 type transport system permease protein
MAGFAAPLTAPLTRGGAGHWLQSYRTLIRWHLAGLRMWLALLATIQVLAGAGFIFGIALFFRHIPATAALFVCTGVPVINLVMVGLILGPQLVAEQKLKGSYDFIRSLPVPRTAAAGAWYTVCLLAGLPAVAVSLALAEARYRIILTVSPAIVPAVLLSALVAVSVGFGMALAIRDPSVANLIANALIFVVLLFSPIVFPAANLPGWLFAVDRVLPFYSMAEVIRAGLTTGLVTDLVPCYLTLLGWLAVGWLMTAWVPGRRR